MPHNKLLDIVTTQLQSNLTQLNTKLVLQGYWCVTHPTHHPTPHKLLDHFKTTWEADFQYTTLFEPNKMKYATKIRVPSKKQQQKTSRQHKKPVFLNTTQPNKIT